MSSPGIDAEQTARIIRTLLQHGDDATAFRMLIIYNDNLAAAAVREDLFSLVQFGPEPTGYPAWDAAIAGITEYRLSRRAMPAPEWAARARLAVPTVVAAGTSTNDVDPSDVPAELLKRNVLIAAQTLG